jgi:hypothetical protein
MDDDFEFIEAPDGQIFMLQDKISARTLSYITLLLEARNLKDPELIAEAMEMLKAIRMSVLIREPLGVVKGGRA